MVVRLKQLRPARTRLRCTRAGARALIYPRGPHKQAMFDFVKWCAAEPGYTVVAVYAPRETPPEALDDVLEDLARCPGVLRLIPADAGCDTTLEFGDWIARRLGRTVVAHEGKVAIVPGGGLYVRPGETGGAGWLRFEPGAAPVAHSRRFPRPGWDCEPFAEPSALGPRALVEPLPAGAWIRPAGDSPAVEAFRGWLLGGMAPDPLLPRIVLGYPGSPAPPVDAVAEFWRSLPAVLHPAVRFSGFSGTDEEALWYGQRLADALDAPVVLGNGVQVAEPSAAGGYETRTVLRRGVMSWPPYAFDLGYLPARSTGGVPADPVPIGHRAPITGLREREPGVYEYSRDAVLEVTQSGLWVRPPALPADSFSVRTEQADPAHTTVVFDAGSEAGAHRMQLLATEMMQRLEPRVRSTARLLASSATGSLLRDRVEVRTPVAVLDRPQEAETAPEAFEAPAENGIAPGESVLNLAVLTEDAERTPAPSRSGGDLASDATMHISIETLLARLAAVAEDGESAPANGEPADGSGWPEDLDDAPVPPAVALYSLAWDPEAQGAEPGADLVSRIVAEARPEQAAEPVGTVLEDAPARDARPVVEDAIPLVTDTVVEAVPALGTIDAAAVRPALVSDSVVVADPVAELGPVVVPGAPAVETPVASAPPTISEPAGFTSAPAPADADTDADAARTQPAVGSPDARDAVSARPASSPAAAPAAQFTVARRRQRKDRAVPPAPRAPVAPPAPRPAEEPDELDEPDEPIVYGGFQLVSSSADLSSGAPSAPAAAQTPPAPAPARQPAPPLPLPAPRPAQPPAPVEPPAQPLPQLAEDAPPAPAAPPAHDAPALAPAPAKRRPTRPAKPAVRVQPVPTPQCSVIPREGLAKERDWLRRNLSKQYDAAASSVARILSEYPGLRVGSSASDSDVLTDLVALRLYLTGKISGLDEAVRAGQVGPHVPLARCVASGLRRLPSYRGPLRTRVTLTADEVQWYGGRSLVTEWSFLPAVASSNLDLPGGAEILIWSMSARRTALLDPSRPDQAVFQPGTSFKVLSVGTGPDGPELRLRELTRTEVAPDGAVRSMPALDEFAAAALEDAGKAWRQADPVEALPADRRDWFASPPGLLAPAARAVPAGAAQEGGTA